MTMETNVSLTTAADPASGAGTPTAFRKVFEGIVIAGLAAGLLLFLIWPYFTIKSKGLKRAAQREDYLLDCFIVRDASMSHRPESQKDYDNIEAEILQHLSTDDGDRISYSLFGGETVPEEGIPLPAPSKAEIEAQIKVTQNKLIFKKTDFEMLFDRLRETIYRDRESQAATKRDPHADAIVILTDGIHDPTESDSKRCPTDDEDYIPDEVVRAFDALIKTNYKTHEAIYVRLVLVGTPACPSDIKGEWERRLGPKGLEVLSYAELSNAPNLGQALLKPLRRHARVVLQLDPLKDEERRRLDNGDKFKIEYGVQSFLRGGEFRIDSAVLVNDEDNELKLQALRNSSVFSTDADHNPIISAPSPASQRLLGKLKRGEDFYLEPASASAARRFLSESEVYSLQLSISALEKPAPGLSPVSIEYDSLKIGPCDRAHRKSQVRERLKLPGALSLILACLFLSGSSAWWATLKSPDATRRQRLNARLERLFVRPYKRWTGAFLILLVPMTVGVSCLHKLGPMGVCVIMCLSLLAFFSEKFRSSTTAHLVLRVAEIAALPLVIEWAGGYLK